jgi:2-methylisocitrate lyase-like PEP mutase family enzyme
MSHALRALHVPGTPLVVPNAWDAASARIIEEAGFAAVATSSNATAAILGYDDGEHAPVDDVLRAATQVARAVEVPVTVDFERGYRLPPAELVERFIATGAVGLNLEDSDPATGELVDPSQQADFLAAVRAAAGDALVINARIDVFLRGQQVESAAERASQYLAAGADCVYPIGVNDLELIGKLVAQIDGPVNVAYGAGAHSVADYAARGVARVSFGPMFQRTLYRRFAETVLPALRADRNPLTD